MHSFQFNNNKAQRFNVTANFTLSESELANVTTAEALRALFNDRLVEQTGGAVVVLCANAEGAVAETCDDPALDVTAETLRAVTTPVADKARVKPRTLVARTLSALYADRFELQPVFNSVCCVLRVEIVFENVPTQTSSSMSMAMTAMAQTSDAGAVGFGVKIVDGVLA